MKNKPLEEIILTCPKCKENILFLTRFPNTDGWIDNLNMRCGKCYEQIAVISMIRIYPYTIKSKTRKKKENER